MYLIDALLLKSEDCLRFIMGRRDAYTSQSVRNQQLGFRLIFQLINARVAVQMHIANKDIVYANLALLAMATNANVSTFIFSLSCVLYQCSSFYPMNDCKGQRTKKCSLTIKTF